MDGQDPSTAKRLTNQDCNLPYPIPPPSGASYCRNGGPSASKSPETSIPGGRHRQRRARRPAALEDPEPAGATHHPSPPKCRAARTAWELVEEDMSDQNHYAPDCYHCWHELAAQGDIAMRRALRVPLPHSRKAG